MDIINVLRTGMNISISHIQIWLSNIILHLIRISLNVCKQMTDIKLLLLNSNFRNNLTVCKQMRKNK